MQRVREQGTEERGQRYGIPLYLPLSPHPYFVSNDDKRYRVLLRIYSTLVELRSKQGRSSN